MAEHLAGEKAETLVNRWVGSLVPNKVGELVDQTAEKTAAVSGLKSVEWDSLLAWK